MIIVEERVSDVILMKNKITGNYTHILCYDTNIRHKGHYSNDEINRYSRRWIFNYKQAYFL